MRVTAALAAFLLFACGPGAEVPDGRQLYLAYGCAACHGEQGDGNGPGAPLSHFKPRDLRDLKRYSGATTVEGIASTIAFGIADGRTGMPAYPDIPKRERVAMAKWIHSLAEARRGVSILGPWAGESNPAWKIAAAYMEIANHEPAAVALVGATSNDAGVVEIHETKEKDGMMSMSRVERVEIGANSAITLQQGGTHLMLIDLRRELRAGDKVDLTLRFDDGTSLQVQAPVKNAY